MLCEIPEFGRCCFCLPLRRGILTFGYVNSLISAFMIGVYSYTVYHGYGLSLVFHGATSILEDEMCLVLYIFDFIFSVVLVYGAHKSHIPSLKTFKYYAITTVVTMFILELLNFTSASSSFMWVLDLSGLFFAGLCLHVYLILLVRSFLKKLETPAVSYENQLYQFVNHEIKDNVVCSSIVVPNVFG
ncbi:uncharacterized protein LOC126964438 [Leptidea sinapis]|uniref:uncharacterized protein LOC126964438 n=1 Tax=Leptidea sinapis TaxID=189913 RepID=UPI00213153AC|nr:uncharacterized protein LOC126964438 [Leptidea sinapis]